MTTVAIIGGGLSGAAVAYHLAQLGQRTKIFVFEPRAILGGGLAYDTEQLEHRTNVPAASMTLIPDVESHFMDWIHRTKAVSDDPKALASDNFIYPRRGVFGRYVDSCLRPLVSAGVVQHVRERVTAVKRTLNGWTVQAGAQVLEADFVVIATTHPKPRVPDAISQTISSDPRLVTDATKIGALDHIRPNARLLVLGAGLTMADIVATLDEQGHYGKIIAVSRHGLRSRGQSTMSTPSYGNFTDPIPFRASELLRRTRKAIADAAAQGISWHAVIDGVRTQAKSFWPYLSLEERGRIVRHLRAYWDVHRFRIAPQLEEVIRRRLDVGGLQFLAGTVERVNSHDDELEAVVRLRGSNCRLARTVEAIILATGPDHSNILKSQAFLSDLEEQGWLRADPIGLGIRCDLSGRAVDSSGQANERLWIAGPLARGSVGELMGLPQVAEFAAAVAASIHSAACEFA